MFARGLHAVLKSSPMSEHDRAQRILASLGPGETGRPWQLRIPLSVFYCTPIRHQIERDLLETRESWPEWSAARSAVDATGAPIRIVPIATVGSVG
jgi:hypothetical protein